MMKRLVAYFLPLYFFLQTGHELYALANRHVLIVCGRGGEEEYERKFIDWGERLKTACANWLGTTAENVIFLNGQTGESGVPTGLAAIEAAFERLKITTAPGDELFVFLIGHGSTLRGVSKFQVAGPDLTADRLKELLDAIPAGLQVAVNGASGSAGFINVLSAPNRIVCTAVKSADERNAPEFMGYFVQGLEQNQADSDRDQRITLLEACRYAADRALAGYKENGLLATEHALIDDNGDGLGTRLSDDGESDTPKETATSQAPLRDASVLSNPDGARASRELLIDQSFPKSAPQDRIDAYLALMEEIENLKSNKMAMDEGEYYRQLESLLLRAAVIHREIRGSSPTATE